MPFLPAGNAVRQPYLEAPSHAPVAYVVVTAVERVNGLCTPMSNG